ALGQPPALWWPLLALAGVCVAFRAIRSGTAGLTGAWFLKRLRTPGWQWGVLVVLSPLIPLGWAARQASREPGPREAQEMVRYEVVLPHATSTDRGRPIPRYRSLEPPPPPDALRHHESQVVRNGGLAEQVIRIPAPWQDCNCHGWVFTGGRGWVLGSDLEMIL